LQVGEVALELVGLADGSLEGNDGNFGVWGGGNGGGGRSLSGGAQGKARGQREETNKRTLHGVQKTPSEIPVLTAWLDGEAMRAPPEQT
jgi:hypothetical protein